MKALMVPGQPHEVFSGRLRRVSLCFTDATPHQGLHRAASYEDQASSHAELCIDEGCFGV
jgi:hypothetical protein